MPTTAERVLLLQQVAPDFIRTLIEQRDALATDALEIDVDAALVEGNNLLTSHAQAVAELTSGAIFDLLALANREASGFDAEAYVALLTNLNDEQLVAQIEATGDEGTAVADVIGRRIALLEGVKVASNVVVRGVLWTALVTAAPQLAPIAGALAVNGDTDGSPDAPA